MITFAKADGGGLAVLNADDDDFLQRFPDPTTWPTYRKNVPTKALRLVGPFLVRTSEGDLRCDDGYLCLDARGYPYPVAREEFDLIYLPENGHPEEVQPMPTLVQQVMTVQARLADLRNDASAAGRPDAAREYSIAITATEDLIMRINRGMAKDDDAFMVGDYEQLRSQVADE